MWEQKLDTRLSCKYESWVSRSEYFTSMLQMGSSHYGMGGWLEGVGLLLSGVGWLGDGVRGGIVIWGSKGGG